MGLRIFRHQRLKNMLQIMSKLLCLYSKYEFGNGCYAVGRIRLKFTWQLRFRSQSCESWFFILTVIEIRHTCF